MITRFKALEILKCHVGKELSDFAQLYKIVICKDGKINKGWKGLACEGMLGITPNNSRAPNGIGFELKSVPYKVKNGLWIPKETMAITMLNQDDLLKEDFLKSHLWEKLKRIIFCLVSCDEKHSTKSTLLDVKSIDLIESEYFIKQIEEDYELIRDKLRTKGYSALTGKDGKWIQARTKGSGHGSTTRAFYARKSLLLEICPSIPLG